MRAQVLGLVFLLTASGAAAQTRPPAPLEDPADKKAPTWVVFPLGPAVGSRVRVGTLAAGSQPLTLVGVVESLDEDALTLAIEKGKKQRIPLHGVTSLEISRKHSSGMHALGGLAGATAGFAVSVLVCLSGETCNSVAPVWIGTALGAGLGVGLVGGGSSWEPVTLASAGRVKLALQPKRSGAGLGVTVGF